MINYTDARKNLSESAQSWEEFEFSVKTEVVYGVRLNTMLTWRSNWEVERSSAGGKCVSLLSLSVRWKKGGKERPRKTSHQCELRFWKKKKKRPTRSLRSISSSIYIYIYFEFGWKCRIVFFLHAVVVGDLVRLNETALFTAFTSIT